MDEQTAAVWLGGTVGILIAIGIWIVVGIVVGLVARLLLPGRDQMSLGKTVLYGAGGAFLGGLIGRVVGLSSLVPSLALAVAVAMVLIWFFTRRSARA
jgi:uncharacterized membrane protein YeaQ/YmgE (transglycosylase-associated protein family)